MMGKLDGRAELQCPRCNAVTVYITSEKTLIASIVREDAKTQKYKDREVHKTQEANHEA